MSDGDGMPVSDEDAPSNLRGPAVTANVQMTKRVALVLVVLTLVALIIGLTIGGIHRNNQVTQIKTHGVPVTVTVTGCAVLTGGTGANPAGYICRGSFAIAGGRHTEVIGGITAFHDRGEQIRAVTDPTDPALLATAHQVATEHTTSTVYIVPGVLLLALIALVVVLLFRRRPDTTGEAATG